MTTLKEEPLPAGGSCLLGSLNLSEFVVKPFTPEARIDYDSLEEAVPIAVLGLNEVLNEGMMLHPLHEQRESVKNWRQIGLGTMGLADMLIKLGIKYGSEEALKVTEEVYKTIAVTAVLTSLDLAKTAGCYPMCNKEKIANSSFIKALNLPENVIKDIKTYGLHNSQLLTCAPTGSIATMLQVSTGVEPNFALKYTRKTQSLNGKDTYYEVFAKIVDDYIGDRYGENIKLPDYFVESKDIAPINRIKMQAVLQKYTDASISSTINLPKEATVDDVYNIYVEAWKHGLKGVTVYRSGCFREGILTTEPSTEHKEQTLVLKRGEIIQAGDSCIGLNRTLMTGCGTLHCQAFFDPTTGELREVYLSKGSTGGCNQFMIGLSRMISLAARGGIGIEKILDQLKSCGVCPSYAVRSATKKDTSKGSCCPVSVGNALRDMHKEILERINNCVQDERVPEIQVDARPIIEELEECPSCHEKTLTRQGGCFQCLSCGYSKCE